MMQIVIRSDSIFTSRAGKEDCSLWKQKPYGVKFPDGNRYACVYRIACESGEILRGQGNCPVTMEYLKDSGLVD